MLQSSIRSPTAWQSGLLLSVWCESYSALANIVDSCSKHVHSDTALAGVKQLDIKVPIVRRPHSGQELETTISHRPYPQIGPEATFAPHGVADQKFTMHVIGAQLVPVMLSEHLRDGALPGYIILEKAERLFRLAEVEQALHRWYEQLPSYARIELFVSTPSIALVDSQ